jgi:hypothetical protein
MNEGEGAKPIQGLPTNKSHDVVLKPAVGFVRVCLVDRAGEPVAGAPCKLLQEGSPIGEGETNEGGEVLWEGLRMTWYEVQVTLPDGEQRVTGVPWLKDDGQPHVQHLDWPPKKEAAAAASYEPTIPPRKAGGAVIPDLVDEITVGDDPEPPRPRRKLS